MAKMNLKYYTNMDQYSDGDIEDYMLEIAKEGKSLEDIPGESVSFPIVYHFSKIRENILSWYPFKKDASVLEIGAGCGAITGMLCEKAKKVTAVELSKRRASINYERHKDCANLELMVGNLNDMEFEEAYDYVVLNGVLEYAAGFTDGETPYQTFLNNMKKYLKKDGRLLIAIENRLGLKYFAGAPEDHTDLYFFGLERYPNCSNVKTFSKTELQQLLKDCGLFGMQFYYPYPDYKFPTEIFTDSSIHKSNYGRMYKDYAKGRVHLFNEHVAAHDLAKEGVADVFANSFLVEAAMVNISEEDSIEYVKLNRDRKEEYQIYTVIHRNHDKKYVTKEAVTSKAKDFISRMGESAKVKVPGSFSNLSCTCEDGRLTYDFIQGKTMMDAICECVEAKDRDGIINIICEFYQKYFVHKERVMDIYSKEFQTVFGNVRSVSASYECICPANIDMICDNIFLGEDENIIIDYEWYFDFPVPAAFIMWRMLNELSHKEPRIYDLVSHSEFLEFLQINEEDEEAFFAWTKHFAYNHVGCDTMGQYEAEPIMIDLRKYALDQMAEKEPGRVMEKKEKGKVFEAKLYIDRGNGLCEEDAISQMVSLQENRFVVNFDLSEVTDAGYFRLDFKGAPGLVYFERLDGNCRYGLLPQGMLGKVYNHYESLNGTYSFVIDTFRPQNVSYLKIEGHMYVYDMDDILGKCMDLEKQMETVKRGAEHALKEVSEETEALAEAVSEQECAAEKKVPMSPRDIARKIKRKLKGQEKAVGSEYYYTPAGCVDDYRYIDNVIYCRGWAFDPSHPKAKGMVAYYSKGTKVEEHKYILVHREDVAAALGTEDALKSGYTFAAHVASPEPLTAVLEFTDGNQTGKMILGEIPADPNAKSLYVEVRDGDGQLGNIEQFISSNVLEKQEIDPAVFGAEIDIIIPVYNGYQFFDELFGTLELTNMRYRLLIVNDKSPDERVLPYLEKYASEHENVILMNNEENLGFVRSVNRALGEAKNHVVLLNTDVAVPYQWLERLMIPIICQEKVATTTPFTTCGTLCSFPQFGKDNKLVGDLSLWQMDEQFRYMKPKYQEIPTGVGFCMGMNIHAIREIGVLDAETFGKGYGEENDWCRRAKEAGYKNVHVDNLFVYHKHGGSFLSEEKQKLLEKNAKALLKKHPDYNEAVARYFTSDPLKATRNYVLMKLWNQLVTVKTIVAFNHNLGGGATEYLVKKEREALRDGHKFITITYDFTNSRYVVDYRYQKDVVAFSAYELEDIFNALGRVDEIWINELVTYKKMFETMEKIVSWKKMIGAKLRILLHDYFPICPAINLMDEQGNYCDVGSLERCEHCIANNISNACEEYGSAVLWRQNWNRFMMASDEIIAFSEISWKLLLKAYPELKNVELIPHEPHYVPALNKKAKTTKTLNIGFLGILSYKKGLGVVQAMAKEIEEQGLDIRLKLIGAVDGEVDSDVFSQTGRYQREQLPRLTLEQDIDIFFIPAIWPETFSYTTSEIMSMNMPIAVFDIGAPVERVSKYNKGLVLPCDAAAKEVLEQISAFAYEHCKVKEMPVHEQKILFLAQEISFASRYRVEHFIEQLLHHGYPSDYVQISQAKQMDIASYKKIVIYRCNDVETVSWVTEKAKKAGISVYYDIDDFIFAYDEITYLDFLKDEEYRTFEEHTKRIHKCMELCDGYLTSTETLKKLIEEHFPGKPVVIKRNVASMEMQILSYNAAKERESNKEKVWIGYFSGSGTHNKDFDIIESVLDEVMEEYPNVHLRLGGVIKDSIMKKYANRSEKLPFMAWQNLPKAVASVDINLMPLEDTQFHCSKSENKWTEAAFAMVPSIMTRNAEMELVVEDKVTGMLCSTKEEWKNALTSMVADKELRKRIARNANKTVLEKYTTYHSGEEAIVFVTKA